MDDDHLFIDSNQHNPVVVFSSCLKCLGGGYDEWIQIFFKERDTHTQRQKKNMANKDTKAIARIQT